MKNSMKLFFQYYLLELFFHFWIALIFYLVDCRINAQLVFSNTIFSSIIGVIFFINLFRWIGGEVVVKFLIEVVNIKRTYKFVLNVLVCLLFIVVMEFLSNGHFGAFDKEFLFHPSFGWNFHLLLSVVLASGLQFRKQ